MDMSAGHDHNHDLSSPASLTHDHSAHGSVQRLPDGSYHYDHGGFSGHILPGVFFIIWGVWWLLATYHTYLRVSSQRRRFNAQAWHPVFFGPDWLRRAPLEPLIMIVFPSIGILGELWIGHSFIWQSLMGTDGKFITDNINKWQHSAMYLAFIASGAVDLIAALVGLPSGTEHGFLGLAFLVEGILLVFHLKGPEIEVIMHLITALLVFATVIAVAAETACPYNLFVASMRPMLTIVQGVWWIQMAYMMFMSYPAYDPDEMGGAMMTPVILVVHMLWVAIASIAVLLVMRFVYSRALGRDVVGFMPLKNSIDANGNARLDEEDGVPSRAVELSGLRYQKE